ncbi:MAG: cobalt ECF transporter T component CbiQ [Candidatus Electrothrix sp. AR4]|nr:cobalt ECF transporter T component CbiQ [Candidatus Electrothrix sp. AR4]
MTFEQFSQGTSLLHRADPRGKLVGTGVLSLIIALCQNIRTALAGLLTALVLVLAARLPWKRVLHRLLVVNSFNILLWFVLPLTYGGTQLIEIAKISLSEPGLSLALLITVKANAIILIFISLLATSTAAQLGHGMQQLWISPKLCLLLLFSYRYIELIYQELQRLRRAAKLRCFQPGTNLHTYKTYSYMLGMLLVRSWNRAARVQQAMLLRGFSGNFHSLHTVKMQSGDLLLSAILLLVGLGLLLFEQLLSV